MESTQVLLRLITPEFSYETEHGEQISGEKILKQMKTNGAIKTDKDGQYVTILFDSKPFVFRAGKVIQVGERVAKALRRSAFIIVGPRALNGPACPFIETVREFEIGEQSEVLAKTACPICGSDLKTFPALTRHLMTKHRDETKGEVDWEGTKTPAAPAEEVEEV